MNAPVQMLPAPALWAGRGAAAAALPATELAVLCDPAVESFVATLPARLRVRTLHGPATLDAVRETAAWLDGAPLLAVGGGTVLDVAKLATLPGAAEEVERRSRRAGFVALPLARRTPLLALPTTIGTGSEVSAVACALVDDGQRVLIHAPSLVPDVAILDPAATATLPPRLVREGAFEALMRVMGCEIASPSTLPMAGVEALSLAQALAHGLDACASRADDELRLSLAALSSATHLGWALRGRGPYPSPLWYVANELAAVLSTTKLTATALLLGAWLRRVAAGDARWGDRGRLASVWAAMRDEALPAEPGEVLLEAWDLAPQVGPRDAATARETARRAVRRWGGRLPMLGRFSEAELAALVS